MADIPDWMSGTQYLILLAMDSSKIIHIYSPSILSENLPATRETIQRSLPELEDRGLIEQLSRGKYRLTSAGRQFLRGELDASEMEADEE